MSTDTTDTGTTGDSGDTTDVDQATTSEVIEPELDGGGDVARLVHPRAIRWLHWINFPLLFIMVWSGLRIYWAEDVYAAGIGGWQWFAFFPDTVYERLDLGHHLARGLAFHFSFGWLFVINGAIYVAYLAITGEWRHIIPDRHAPREAAHVVLHDVHIDEQPPPQGKYNAAQRISYTVVLAMALILVVSGFAIYKPTQLYPLPLLFGGYQGARLIHFTMTIGLLAFFVVHVLQVVRSGWGNFRSMVTGYQIERRESTPDRRPPVSATGGAGSEAHSTDVDEVSA